MYEELPIGRRIVITAAVVIAIILLLALFGFLSGRWEDAASAAPSKEIALCSDDPGINDEINRIAAKALEDALERKIGSLFDVWMRDNTGQPERAATGVRGAAVAYVHARKAIFEWNIPSCTQEQRK